MVKNSLWRRSRRIAAPVLVTVTLILTSLSLQEPPRHAAAQLIETCRWDSGSSGSWHDASRWDCGGEARVPTIDDDVVVDATPSGASLEVSIAADAEARSLSVGEMDDSLSQRHRIVMQAGQHPDKRVLTIGDGGVLVHRSGWMRIGQEYVASGVGATAGSIGVITGPEDQPVTVTVHGSVRSSNMHLTGDLIISHPPGVTDGAFALFANRGASVVSGQIDVAAGGYLRVFVNGAETPQEMPRPARVTALGGDLTVHDGALVSLLANTETNYESGIRAVATPDGAFVNHGNAVVHGDGQYTTTVRVDTPVVNHGELVTRSNGLELDGPAGTVHENHGRLVVGDRDDPPFGLGAPFQEVGGPLVVHAGNTLANTGEVVIDHTRTASGMVTNTEGGTVTDTVLVDADGTATLGFAGPQQVLVGVSHDGGAEAVTVTWHGADHPDAGSDALVEGTDHWWDLETAVSVVSLTLPRLTDRDDPVVCRPDGGAPTGWECLEPEAVSGSAVSIGAAAGAGDWAVGGTLPVDPPEPVCRWDSGSSGSWHDASRWDCGGEARVPTIDDDVVVDATPSGASLAVSIGEDAEARSLTVGEMDDERSQRHQVLMVDGQHPNPRVLTIGDGGVLVHRSGMLRTGDTHVPFGVSARPGDIGVIAGPEAEPVGVTVYGLLNSYNMHLTGDLVVDRPPGVADGPRGQILTRGASTVSGVVDVEAGGQIFTVVEGQEAPQELPRPPRLGVLGGDLTVHPEGSVHAYGSTGLATNYASGIRAFATPNGSLVNHGFFVVWGDGEFATTVRIEGPLINHGFVRTVRQGLELDGPAGTVHENHGVVTAGDRGHEQFTETGGPLVVRAGNTLANTGEVVVDHTRTASGTATNTEGGTVTDTVLVDADGTETLGFAGPQQVLVGVSHDGAAEPVTVTWHGADHPDASSDPLVAGTGAWWELETDVSVVSLTLPRLVEREDPVVCRPDGGAPTGWECLEPEAVSGSAVSIGAAAGAGAWALGGTLPVDPPEPVCRWDSGSSGSWHDASRWDCGGEARVPTIDDDVVVDATPSGANLAVSISADAEARSLSVGEMDDTRSQRHQVLMVDGQHPNPRVLTIGDGGVLVHRSGMLRTGRPHVPFGVGSHPGDIGVIAGPEGEPVSVTVYGLLNAYNMHLTGDLFIERPPGVADGPTGLLFTRGASTVSGVVDVRAGGAISVLVEGQEAPQELPRPPRLTVLGGDLTVHPDGSVWVYGSTGTGTNYASGIRALATPNGSLVNHGHLEVSGDGQFATTVRIEGPLINHGLVRTFRQGLELDGPAGTVHENYGVLTVGDRDEGHFTETGGPLVVRAGNTLANTGEVVIDHTRTASGVVTNTEGGTVTDTVLVDADGTATLGFAGPQQVLVGVSHDGAAEPVTVIWHGADHPEASSDPLVAGTGAWWDLETTVSVVSLTLPRLTDRDDPVVCRPDGGAPTGWECLEPEAVSGAAVSIGAPAGAGAWAVGGTSSTELFGFDLFDADATGVAPTNAYLLSLLTTAVYRWVCGEDFCPGGYGGATDNDEWFANFSSLAEPWRFSDPVRYRDDETGADGASVRTDDAVIFSFRGTEGAFSEDMSTNADLALHTEELSTGDEVQVHRGFWFAVDSIYADVRATAEIEPDAPIWTTGHSLGGAMAAIVALRLAADGFDVRGVHTFGAPDIGGPSTTQVYDSLGLGDRTHRWINDLDMIPKLLVNLSSYDRHGRIHVFTRNSDDDLDASLELETTIPEVLGGMDDHDDTLYGRRILDALVESTDRDRLPAPYHPPPDPPPGWWTEYLAAMLVAFDSTVDMVLEVLAYLGLDDAAIEEFVDLLESLGFPVDKLDELRDRLLDLLFQLAGFLDMIEGFVLGWLGGLELDPELVPLLPEALDAIFALGERWTAIAADLRSVLHQAVDEAAQLGLAGVVEVLTQIDGLTIHHAALEGFDPPPEPGDLLEATWRITAEDLAALTGLDPVVVTTGLLDALASNLDLDVDLSALVADLAVEVRFGIDADGFYLAPGTRITLSVAGDVSATGTAAALGHSDVAVTLDGAPALEVSLESPWTTRVRLDDEAALGAPWTPSVDGSLTATAALARGPLSLLWSGSFVPGEPVIASLAAALALPGLTQDGEPASLVLTGERQPGGTWLLAGGLDAEGDYTIDELTVRTLDAELEVGPDLFAGSATMDLEVDLGGTEPIVLEAELTLDGDGFTLEGSVDLAGAYLISAGELELARLDNTRVSVAGAGAFDPDLEVVTLDLTVTITADRLVLLPAMGDDGVAVVQPLEATLSSAGGLSLGFDELELTIDDVLGLHLTDVQVELGGDPATPLLVAATADFSLGQPFEIEGELTDLRVERDGAITAATAAVTSSPGDLDLGVDLAGLLPFTIEAVSLAFEEYDDPVLGQRVRLDRFTLLATGSLDLSQFESDLGASLTVRVGDLDISDGEPFQIGVAVDSLDPLVLRPIGLGALTLGIEGLQIGSVTIDAEVVISGDWDEVVLSGTVIGTSGLGGAAIEQATLEGTLDADVMDVVLSFDASDASYAGIALEDASFELGIRLERDPQALLLAVSSFTGSALALVPLGDGFVQVPVSVDWNGDSLRLTGGLVAGTLAVEVAGTTVALLEDVDLTVDLEVTDDATTVGVDLEVGSIELFPDLAIVTATGTGVTAQLGADGVLLVSIDELSLVLAGAFEAELENLELTIDPLAPPAASLLSVATLEAVAPSLGGLTVHLDGLTIGMDGSVSVTGASVETNEVDEVLGIAGVLPFSLTRLELVFTEPGRLDTFELAAAGAFDLSALELGGASPVLGIGDPEDCAALGIDDPGVPPGQTPFCFSVAFDPDLGIRPVDLGPIMLGVEGLDAGPVSFDLLLEFAGYTGGVLDPTVEGIVRLAGGIDEVEGEIEASLAGTVDVAPTGGGTLHLAATLTVSGRVSDLVELENLRLAGGVSLGFDRVDGLEVSLPSLDAVTYDRLAISVMEFVTFASGGGVIDLTAGVGDDLVVFDGTPATPGLGIEFHAGAGPLEGWGGGVSGVALRMTELEGLGVAVPVPVLLDGFSADIEFPEGLTAGFPEWLPFDVRAIGFTLPENLGFDLDDLKSELEITPELFAELLLRFSGGFDATEMVPITADVEGLEVDMAKLFAGEFPIENLDAFTVGVEPFPLGPITIGGVLGFGTIDIDVGDGTESVLYGRIAGEFTYDGIGAGIELVLSEYGPVIARVTAPMAIPLGKTTLLLSGLHGGIRFGGPGFVPPEDPEDILVLPEYDLDFPMGRSDIASAVEGCAIENAGFDWSGFWTQPGLPSPEDLPPCFTWMDGGTLFVGATMTSYALPGVISGDVTLAANLAFEAGELPKLRFAGKGDLNLFGFPMGTTGFLLSLDDPLAPMLNVAARAPGGTGNPLGFVMPAAGNLGLQLDTTGIVLGGLLGSRAFFEALATGSLELATELFEEALERLAARLHEERHLLVSHTLLDLDGNGVIDEAEAAIVIDAGFLVDRVLGSESIPGLLAEIDPVSSPETLADLTATMGLLEEAFLGEVAAVLGDPDSSNEDLLAGVDPADPLVVLNQDTVGLDQARALAAFGQAAQQVLGDATSEAGAAFSEVFDPSLRISGALQPMLLGVPLGDPTEEIEVTVNRRSIEIAGTTSPSTMFVRLAATGGLAFAELKSQLGISETITYRAQLPLEGVLDTLFEAGPLAIDPFDPEWSITTEMGLRFAGLELGTLTGMLIGPGNQTLLDQRVWKTYEPLPPGGIGGRIPVTSPEHYDAILTHGGILMTGELRVPDLLIDPMGTFAALELEPPENLLEYPGWIEANLNLLRGITSAGSFQLFVPGFTNLIDPSYEDGIWTVDYTDDAGRYNFTESGEALVESLQEVLDTAYVDAVWDGKLLGVELATGYLRATPSGYEVEAEFPFLAEPVTVRLGGSEIGVGGDGGFLPSALVDIALGTDELAAVAAALGLPEIVEIPASAAGALRIATPGYELTSDDPLLVRGGIEATLELVVEPLLGPSTFHLTVLPTPGVDPFLAASAPDFIARTEGRVELLPLAGVGITDALVEVRRVDGQVSVQIEGTATFGGATLPVAATLGGDLTGEIRLGAGDRFTVGGFSVEGGARIVLARPDPRVLEVSLESDLLVTVPGWLAELLGVGQVAAEGSVASDGSFDLLLEVDELAIGSTGLTIEGIDGDGPSIRLVGQVASGATVQVEGVLAGVTGLPSLTVRGSFHQDGTGGLEVTIPGDSLLLDQFLVTEASAFVERHGEGWVVAFEGMLSIPGLGSDLPVGGRLESSGPVALSVALEGFKAGPVTVQALELELARTAGDRWALRASGTASIPGVGANLGFEGAISPDGDLFLELDRDTLVLHGVAITDATFTVRHLRRMGSTTLDVEGHAELVGVVVEVAGSLSVGDAGDPSGLLRVSMPGGGPFTLAGVAIAGSVELRIGSTPGIEIAGTLSVPGIATGVGVTGELSVPQGLGSLALDLDEVQFGLGSPFWLSGDFQLERSVVGRGVHTAFSAENATLGWLFGAIFEVTSAEISTSGAVDVQVAGQELAVGMIRISLPDASFTSGPGASSPTLSFGPAGIHVLGLFGAEHGIELDPFEVGADGNLAATLSEGSLPMGLLAVDGTIELRKSGGVWSLHVARAGSKPASLRVPGIPGSIELADFTISSNGTFSVVAASRRLGGAHLAVQGASIQLRRQGTPAATEVVVSGGELHVPVLDPIELESFSISDQGALAFDFDGPLRFGPVLERPSNLAATISLTLELGPAGFELRQRGGHSFRLLGAANLTLAGFTARADGTITGSLTGTVALPMASGAVIVGLGTLTLSRSGPVVRLTIPASRPHTVDLRPTVAGISGSLAAEVHGWIDTAGRMDLSLKATADLTFLGVGAVGAVSGTFTAGALSADFNGQACYGFGCLDWSVGIDVGAGNMLMPRSGPFPILRPLIPALDTTPPFLAPPEDIVVRAPAGSTVAVVNYALPVAVDDRDPAPVVTCTAPPGSSFAVGTRTVTCTARDATGNVSAPRTFTVTVESGIIGIVATTTGPFNLSDPAAGVPTVKHGDPVSVLASGFAVSTTVAGRLFSEPYPLGETLADEDGTATLVFTVPHVAPGPHTLTLDGRAPDGTPLHLAVPVVVEGEGPGPGPGPSPPPPPPGPPGVPPTGPPVADPGGIAVSPPSGADLPGAREADDTGAAEPRRPETPAELSAPASPVGRELPLTGAPGLGRLLLVAVVLLVAGLGLSLGVRPGRRRV